MATSADSGSSNVPVELWGDLPPIINTEWDKVVPKELGKLVIVSAIKPELPKTYQPVPDESFNSLVELPGECSSMDVNVLDTIKLIQHAKRVQELIDIANSPDETNKAEKIKNCPPFPDITEKKSINTEDNDKLASQYQILQENELSPFASGLPVKHVSLQLHQKNKILQKTVATIAAHVGFDTSKESALEVLTSVADDFLHKFTFNLRYAVEEDILHGSNAFPDVIEQVYYKMGLGSVTMLKDFYQTKILDYKDKVRDECLRVLGEYEVCCALLQCNDPVSNIRFKTEEEDDNNIPEIHFPATGDGDGVDELEPSLQPEFEMLDMLEQGTQQNLN